MKLTGPQKSLLKDIGETGRYVSDTYAPAKALVATGLAEWGESRFSTFLRITDKGLRALSQASGEPA